jgi:hypothetical protein
MIPNQRSSGFSISGFQTHPLSIIGFGPPVGLG